MTCQWCTANKAAERGLEQVCKLTSLKNKINEKMGDKREWQNLLPTPIQLTPGTLSLSAFLLILIYMWLA